jgi:hypothetical protein
MAHKLDISNFHLEIPSLPAGEGSEGGSKWNILKFRKIIIAALPSPSRFCQNINPEDKEKLFIFKELRTFCFPLLCALDSSDRMPQPADSRKKV